MIVTDGERYPQSIGPGGMVKSAYISGCGNYRYWLRRQWAETGDDCLWIMLNPSKADAFIDDPTLSKITSYTLKWSGDAEHYVGDFRALEVVNLFPYRATNPKELLTPRVELIGSATEAAMVRSIHRARLIVAAWGNGPFGKRGQRAYQRRIDDVLTLCAERGKAVHMLGRNVATGQPVHPLYQKGDLRPIPFTREAPTC